MNFSSPLGFHTICNDNCHLGDYKNSPLHQGNIYLLLPKGLTRSRQLADLQLYRNLLSMTPFNSMTTRCSCTWMQNPSTLHSNFTLPAWQHHKWNFRNQRHFTSSSQSSSFMLWYIANFQNFSTSKGKHKSRSPCLNSFPGSILSCLPIHSSGPWGEFRKDRTSLLPTLQERLSKKWLPVFFNLLNF